MPGWRVFEALRLAPTMTHGGSLGLPQFPAQVLKQRIGISSHGVLVSWLDLTPCMPCAGRGYVQSSGWQPTSVRITIVTLTAVHTRRLPEILTDKLHSAAADLRIPHHRLEPLVIVAVSLLVLAKQMVELGRIRNGTE